MNALSAYRDEVKQNDSTRNMKDFDTLTKIA